MVLRIATFLCLVALAVSQEPTVGVPTDAPDTTMAPEMPTTMAPEMPTTMADAPTTMMMPTEEEGPTPEVPSLSERYGMDDAVMQRRNHYYCLDVNEVGFPQDRMETRNPDGTIMNTQVDLLWAVMFQYPVLSYLSTQGKSELLEITARLVRLGAPAGSPLTNFNESDFCIANVTHYGVSTYNEAVLINVYFQGDIMVTPGDPDSGVSIEDFNTAFEEGFRQARTDSSNRDVVLFLGRWYAYNMTTVAGERSEIVSPDEDPTQRAVLISSFEGNTTIDAASAARDSWLQQFAENPNPISLGLEAGDIIFAVFGTIFLTVVGGLIILGFCIHPFFLA